MCACGRSSFGKVFKALHHTSNQIVAVKIVPLDDDQGELEREIEMLRDCESPHVVQYHGSFVHAAQLWIMMEYCEGSSLLYIMAATGRCLTEVQLAAALASCVEALLFLHASSRIHRDVKAGNLLLNSDGVVKLADFGVAASLQNSVTRRRTVIGTPFWMAPEVITCKQPAAGGKNRGYDELADVWSLGITAIELAEGQPPHANVFPLTAIFLIPTLPAPKLSEPKRWSPNFGAFLSRALTKDPEERSSTRALSTDPFIVDGRSASEGGTLRALMAASREPLRAFRDRSAAKLAARQQRKHEPATDAANDKAGGTMHAGGTSVPSRSRSPSRSRTVGGGSSTLPRPPPSPRAPDAASLRGTVGAIGASGSGTGTASGSATMKVHGTAPRADDRAANPIDFEV